MENIESSSPDLPTGNPPDNITTAPAENPGQIQFPELAPTQSANELATEKETPASTGIAEKIRSTGASMLAACGVPIKRGPGRPRKDGLPKKSDVVAPIPAANIEIENPLANVPPEEIDSLFRDSILSGVEGGKELCLEIIRDKADQAGIDRAFTEQALAHAENPKVSKDFAKSLDLVARKYAVKTEYAPEVALLINGGRMALPFVFLLRTFNREIERRRQEGKGVRHE